MSLAIRSMFDRIAPGYDRVNRTLSLGTDQRWRKQAVAAISGDSIDRVLDLCAGTMDISVLLRNALPDAAVVAADFSREMLVGGMNRSTVRASTIAPVQTDALSLPFVDASFDAAICGFGVRNLDDPGAGLAEVARVLVPGGTFAVLEFFRPESRRQRLFHRVYNTHVLPTVGGWITGNRDAYLYLAESMENFMPLSEFLVLGEHTGFTVSSSRSLFPGVASLVVFRKPGAAS